MISSFDARTVIFEQLDSLSTYVEINGGRMRGDLGGAVSVFLQVRALQVPYAVGVGSERGESLNSRRRVDGKGPGHEHGSRRAELANRLVQLSV
jgi:hypothetical protein